MSDCVNKLVLHYQFIDKEIMDLFTGKCNFLILFYSAERLNNFPFSCNRRFMVLNGIAVYSLRIYCSLPFNCIALGTKLHAEPSAVQLKICDSRLQHFSDCRIDCGCCRRKTIFLTIEKNLKVFFAVSSPWIFF